MRSLLSPCRLRGAAPHLQTQRTAFVQVPKLDKLLGHGMEPRVGQDVVVVMVADRLLVQVEGERPEAVSGHFLAQPQGQTDQEEPRGEAFGVHAVGLPEFPHCVQELRVGKEHGEVGGGVCQGVIRPQWRVGARLHGERRHVDVAGAVDLHAVHKGFSRPQQVLKPEDERRMACETSCCYARTLFVQLLFSCHFLSEPVAKWEAFLCQKNTNWYPVPSQNQNHS